MIERGGQVVIEMLENVKQQTIAPLIQATIIPGATVFTDEYGIYGRLSEWGTSTRVYVMPEVNMPVMMMATDFVKYM